VKIAAGWAGSRPVESRVPVEPGFERVAGYLVRRAHQAHDAIFARETAGFDVTSPQHAALLAIAASPGIELTPLGEMIGYDGATLAGLVARLKAKKLIRRTVGKHDRRTRQLFLTPHGTALLELVSPRAARVHDQLLEPLSRVERDVFIDMMQRVVRHGASSAAKDESEIA
jgi:DNA-binding MarR family transcriptional regulator